MYLLKFMPKFAKTEYLLNENFPSFFFYFDFFFPRSQVKSREKAGFLWQTVY